MKLFNKIFTILVNAAVMGVVILIMKNQDDVKQIAQQNSSQLYSNLINTNNIIEQNRTDKTNQILNQISAGKLAPASSGAPAKPVTPAVPASKSQPAALKPPVTVQPPVVQPPASVQPPVVSVPVPNPVVIAPAPQPTVIPNRTTRTS